MKKNFISIATLALALSTLLGQVQLNAVESNSAGGATMVSKEEEQEAEFDQQLKEEISKQKEDILRLEKQVTQQNKNFEGDLKDEFVGKMNSLEVKQILYKKFQGSSSIKNPAIRAKLLELFKKPIVAEKDIKDLQTFIDQQKAKG